MKANAKKIQIARQKILSIEEQAEALAHSMKDMHGGEWRYLIDPISRNVFITQFSPSVEVRKRK